MRKKRLADIAGCRDGINNRLIKQFWQWLLKLGIVAVLLFSRRLDGLETGGTVTLTASTVVKNT
jgi:hypothetical protein